MDLSSRALQNSLRARLLVAVLLLLTAALVIAVVAFERSARVVVMESVGSHVGARAHEVLDATRRFQTERCFAVRNWAEADAMQSTLDTGDPKFAEDYLRRSIQDQGGTFSAVALLDLQGNVVAAVRASTEGKRRGEALEQLRGHRVSVRPAALALRGAPLSVATAPGARLDPADASPMSLFVAVPVKDFANDVVGAVVASVPASAVSRLLSEVAGDDRRYLPIIGETVAGLAATVPGVDLGAYAPLLSAPGVGGTLQRSSVRGEPVFVVKTIATDGEPEWQAVVVASERDAYAPVRRMRRYLLALFIPLLAGAALTSVVALRRAAQPLSDVSASMARVSSGDLTTRIPEVYGDDLGHLARSFNHMVAEVARSRDELRGVESLRKEMQIAQQIQTAILPQDARIPGFEIAARMKAAADVGGDLYDVIAVDDTFWIVIGDVSGHGINSGLVMLMAQSAAYAAITANPHRPPAEVIGAVNRVVYENVRRRMRHDDYVTLMVARHVAGGRFIAAGAHQPMFVVRSGREVEVVDPAGPWVGVMPKLPEQLGEYEVELGPGDSLCLITDGIVEARNGEQELFGEERLTRILARERRPAADTLQDIFASVEAFTAEQADDMTAIVIQREDRTDGSC